MPNVLTGKRNKELTYHLSKSAVRAVQEYINVITREPILDVSRMGLRDIIMFRCDKLLGKHVTPHTWRYSFAVHILMSGTDIRFIKEFLNHSSLTTTEIYTWLYDDQLKDALIKGHPANRLSE